MILSLNSINLTHIFHDTFISSSATKRQTGGWINKKISSCQYRKSHVKDKTVSPTVLSLTWESPYLGKTVFILRRGPDSIPKAKMGRWNRSCIITTCIYNVKNWDNLPCPRPVKIVWVLLCLLCPPGRRNVPGTALLNRFQSPWGALKYTVNQGLVIVILFGIKDLWPREITIKLKFNLCVGPVNSFPIFLHYSYCQLERVKSTSMEYRTTMGFSWRKNIITIWELE